MKRLISMAILFCFMLGITPAAMADEVYVTRGEFIRMLVEEIGINAKIYTDRFADVSSADLYSDIYEGAAVCGIINGGKEGSKSYLYPNRSITGNEAAVMCERALAFMHVKGSINVKDGMLTVQEAQDALAQMKHIYDESELDFGNGELNELINSVKSQIKDADNKTAQEYFDSATEHLSFDASESEKSRALEELRMAKGALYDERDSFVTGGYWFDDNGGLIQAHGGNILYDEKSQTYYWYGEARQTSQIPEHLQKYADWGWRIGVSCYSSKDLYNWKYEGLALEMLEEEGLTEPMTDIGLGRVIERPKVIYNKKTDKYVMWMHIDNGWYGYSRAGVAVSDSPQGPFTYINSYRPGDKMARDMTVFVDDDEKAYIYFSTDENGNMAVCALSDDYLTPAGDAEICIWWKWREAPAVFKYNKTYYMITSGCSGWAPNAADYATAPSPMGPWTQHGNPCVGEGADKTFGGQSAWVQPINAENGEFIFIADIWRPSHHSESGFIWLPIRIHEDGSIQISWTDEWKLEDLDIEIGGSSRFVKTYGDNSLLPESVNVTAGGETKTAKVSWNMGEYDENMHGHYRVSGELTDYAGLYTSLDVYNIPENLVYFVDCGANGNEEMEKIKSFGNELLNSAADQEYKADSVTGKKWGYKSDFVTGNKGDGTMYESVRYDFSDGGEEAVGKGITYIFELDGDKTYDVYVGIKDPWNEDGRYEDIYVNGELKTEKINLKNQPSALVYEKISPSEGKIEVKAARNKLALSPSLDPLISFIMIGESKDAKRYELVAGGNRLVLEENSLWSFTPRSDGSFVITAKNGEKSLDVANGSKEEGNAVILYNTNGNANQRWFLEKQPGGAYYIRSAASSLYLTFKEGKLTQEKKENASVWNVKN